MTKDFRDPPHLWPLSWMVPLAEWLLSFRNREPGNPGTNGVRPLVQEQDTDMGCISPGTRVDVPNHLIDIRGMDVK
jgi:hypothetical protein